MIPGEYIVVFKDQWEGKINTEVAREALQFVNEKIREFNIDEKNINSRYEHALRGFAAKLTDEQLEAIKNNPQVDFVEQNRHFNGIESTSVSAMKYETTRFMSQTTPWGITRVGGSHNGIGKKAWILDTGIDLDNPDLNVDVGNSASYVGAESADDLNGHGTHVAGILAAKDNAIDVVGVAAGASVVSVKVLDKYGFGNTQDVVDGINYIAGRASSSHVVNMSLSSPPSTAIDNAVINTANAGIRFSVAAGNQAIHASNRSPARVNHSNVWTISGYDNQDKWYNNSNYGNPPVDYGGPAVNIPSLDIGGGIVNKTGTSMAAPHVAGLLLAMGKEPYTNKYVSGDPDSNPDPIAASSPYVETPVVTHSVQIQHPKLDWQVCEGADEYKVYRKVNSSGSWTLWTTTSSNSYVDMLTSDPNLVALSGGPNGPTGWIGYKVKSVHDDGFSSQSVVKYYEFSGIVIE